MTTSHGRPTRTMKKLLTTIMLRMKAITIMSSLISLMAAGCASPTAMSNQRPVAKERIVQLPVAAHPEHAARVTVVRDSGGSGVWAPIRLIMNGKPVASFRPAEAMTFSLDPGEYVFRGEVWDKNPRDYLEYALSAEAGRHYYYRISFRDTGVILQRSYAVSQ